MPATRHAHTPTHPHHTATHTATPRQARQLFKELPALVDVAIPRGAHFTVCGDVHGQFYDLLHIWELNGLPSPDNPYVPVVRVCACACVRVCVVAAGCALVGWLVGWLVWWVGGWVGGWVRKPEGRRCRVDRWRARVRASAAAPHA
jgi:hypothetical protein